MDEDVWELACRVRDDIRAGDVEAGLLLLDRILDRKWSDITECDGQYRMFKPDGAIDNMHNFFAKALGMQVSAHCAPQETYDVRPEPKEWR